MLNGWHIRSYVENDEFRFFAKDWMYMIIEITHCSCCFKFIFDCLVFEDYATFSWIPPESDDSSDMMS